MEIIVEIGTSEQREIIAEELELLKFVAQKLDPPLLITKLIVTEKFEERVNEIEGTSNYIANRDLVNAIARVCDDGDGHAIIVSYILYTGNSDVSIRYFVLFHELAHLLNKRDFQPISNDNSSTYNYAFSLSHLYDEYCADRLAYKLSDVAFPEKSQFWVEYYNSMIEGYKDLITNNANYDAIRREILAFRHHGNVNEFIEKTRVYYDSLAIVMAHTFALCHQYPGVITDEDLSKSKFVNEKTINLMNYFSKKYEDKSFDLTDGKDLIIDFMTNFGIKLEDQEQGLYCYVLDI